MLLAVHMKNINNDKERVYKTEGLDASPENWDCPDFYYGSEWVWTGTEPFANIEGEYRPEEPWSQYYIHR